MGFEKPGFSFDLNGASSKGPTHVVRAARDPVSIPTEPAIVELAKRCLCILGLGSNCYTLTNVYGVTAEVPYGASVQEWTKIATGLLEAAIAEDAR